MVAVIGTLSINAALLREIKQESQRIRDVLNSLRRVADHPEMHYAHRRRFVELLGALCDQLALHFVREESIGYSDGRIAPDPELGDRAEALHGEHVALFDFIRDIAHDADQAEAQDRLRARLPAIMQRFREFDAAFERHESAENALIGAALGAVDA